MTRQEKLKEIEKYITAVAKTAPRMYAYGKHFATLKDSDGDACLFNGLLATTGLGIGRAGVSLSQAKSGEIFKGMFYRSPIRRSYGDALMGHKSYFSRDMALGVLAYYASIPKLKCDELSARAWMRWIDKNRACLAKKPKWLGGGCFIRGPHRYAPDERSLITPTMWALMGRVWDHRGWDRSSQMKTYEGSDGDLSILEAEQCELGYQLHLKVVQAYIKMIIGQSREYSQRVGKIAHDRLPENIFYEFIARRHVTDEMIDRFLEMKPPLSQRWGSSWLWEKADVTQERIDQSCGWDFVFMGRLLLAHT